MRDPMSWAITAFRAFGIPVKVHLFFFVITLGLFLRQVTTKDTQLWWVDVLMLTVVVLFGIILLHEFGHCFGARAVGGDAKEILIWPLGGLAFNDIPHHPRAHFLTAAAGPAVNAVICLVCALVMFAAGYLPNLNPIASPYAAEIYNVKKDRADTSYYDVRLYRPDTNAEVTWNEVQAKLPPQAAVKSTTPEFDEAVKTAGYERGRAPSWVVWVFRIFWLSWLLLLFNLIPAYPLDGGQMLQAVVWARTDYRRGVVISAYSGFGVSVVFLIASIAANEALFMGLALFMLYSASMKLFSLEMEDGPFGYDFSAGYTSLERDEEPAPKPKQPGYFARWWQARKARKVQREREQRARDEERKELLLEKIAASGMTSLTDEERRFLEQFSARYRNRG